MGDMFQAFPQSFTPSLPHGRATEQAERPFGSPRVSNGGVSTPSSYGTLTGPWLPWNDAGLALTGLGRSLWAKIAFETAIGLSCLLSHLVRGAALADHLVHDVPRFLHQRNVT